MSRATRPNRRRRSTWGPAQRPCRARLLLEALEERTLAAGTWVATGSMGLPRVFHTATLLENGTVLVAGARDSAGPAELYNPVTGAFSPTGRMGTDRAWHTATRLSDGRVLVTGGAVWGGPVFATAELYDPAQGTWGPAESMADRRGGHTATLLADGRVLVTGGSGNTVLRSSEIYDPATGQWRLTGSMNEARSGHTAVLLNDGRVLVYGGWYGGPIRSAELYDPRTGGWSRTSSTFFPLYYPSGVRLWDGSVLVTGDPLYGGSGRAEVYDPQSATWRATRPMNTKHVAAPAVGLQDGTVLIAGGAIDPIYYGVEPQSPRAEVYNVYTDRWTDTPDMVTGRAWHTLTLLADGRALATGGVDHVEEHKFLGRLEYVTRTAELYVPERMCAGTRCVFPRPLDDPRDGGDTFHAVLSVIGPKGDGGGRRNAGTLTVHSATPSGDGTFAFEINAPGPLAERPTLPRNPHTYCLSVDIPAWQDIALGAQSQTATSFASDGRTVLHPEPARFFEVPIQLPLPEGLNYIP